MKREVERADFMPYAARPTWTLHLSCGHDAAFSARGSQAKPPRVFDCAECDREVAARSYVETNEEKERDMSTKVEARVGMQALFGKHHVCVALRGKDSVWWPVDGKTAKQADGPFGLRLVSETEHLERLKIAETLTQDPASHQSYKVLTEQRVNDLFHGFAVSDDEAARIEQQRAASGKKKVGAASVSGKSAAQANGAAETEDYTPAAKLRALGKAGVGRQHGRAIAAVLWPAMKPYLPMDYIWEGQNGKGTIAPLTDKQIADLKAVAPDPKAAKAEASK